jgi:Uncharacterized protein conserved in bacteria
VITPTEIKQKAVRYYLPFLQSWLRNETFSPYSISAGVPPADFAEFRNAVETLYRNAKEQRGYGYSVVTQFKRMRQHGDQNLPVRIVIETPQDLLRLIDKEEEFEHFQQDISLIRTSMPQLNEWLLRYPQRVIEQRNVWPDLLKVCAYFLEHPRQQRHVYIRELPITVHTKFIEQHRGILQELLKYLLPADSLQLETPTFEQRFGLREDEPLVRIRFLDNQLLTQYTLPFSDISLPLSQFAGIDLQDQCCIVTENKMTFLTLPALCHTFAVFGGGFMVNNLANLSWLSTCPILYWGDLDAQGFQILSQLRSLFPHVISMMMDEITLRTFATFRVAGTPCPIQHLPYLTEEEHLLFTRLAKENIRLEQERITHTYALTYIQECFQRLRYHEST